MDILFLGAAREVTGSRYLLSAAGQHVLIDCGMEQGRDTYENQSLPFKPAQVDCVVLTHAHIDHSGMLPALYKEGFRGDIWATPATISLCDIMLRDSAHIQEMEAEWRNRKAQRGAQAPYEPIYTTADAEGVLALMKPAPYAQAVQIMSGIQLAMTDAGHLLGSASATLDVEENGTARKIVFSGDIGNLNQPIINDPKYLTQADIVVMESTYGDRLHGPRPDYIADLADVLQTTFDRGGHVVIPSFAVGRTQEILYFLREIKEQNLIRGHNGFKVFLDSPLAIRATNIFSKADAQFFDAEMNALLDRGVNPISFDGLELRITADESKAINFEKEPGVIISASGMCEAGRIRHHLKHNLWRPECTVLFVGYQSVGTLGRALVDGAKQVKIFGEDISVQAQIRELAALSGHADRDGLKKWADSFNPRPKRFYICHGEESVAEAFAQLLAGEGNDVEVPYNGDRWDLVNEYLIEKGPRTMAAGYVAEDAGDSEDSGDVTPAARQPGRQPDAARNSRRQRLGEQAQQADQRQAQVDRRLDDAVQRLERLIRKGGGWSNGIKKQLAEQINALSERWE